MKLATMPHEGRAGPLPDRADAPGSLETVVGDLARWVPWFEAFLAAPGPAPRRRAPRDPPAAPGKVVAVGLNYADHGAEGKVALPVDPLLFAKFPSSIVGPEETITWDPALTDAVDYEVGLAVVIGRRARNVLVDAALDHVFGYTCLNDVSARGLKFWTAGGCAQEPRHVLPRGPLDRDGGRDPRPAGARN